MNRLMNKCLTPTAVAVLGILGAGESHAFTDPNLVPEARRIYIGGASASSNLVRSNFVQNLCRTDRPIDVFFDGTTGDPPRHNNNWVVLCETDSSIIPNFDSPPATPGRVAIFKSDAGGSFTGIGPLQQDTNLTFINPAVGAGQACGAAPAIDNVPFPGGTYDLYVCGTSNTIARVPNVGISDVEPNKFVGPLATTGQPGFDPSPARAFDRVVAGPGLIFGVAVTNELYDALQQAQIAAGSVPAGCAVGSYTEDCMPSLTRAEATSLTIGRYGNWNRLLAGNGSQPLTNFGAAPQDLPTLVNVCRRVNGSGTHAQYALLFHGVNCTNDALQVRAQPGNALAGPLVYENSGASNVGDCLEALNNGSGFSDNPGTSAVEIAPNIPVGRDAWGIGYQSTEQNASASEPYRFVKVDHYPPTCKSVHSGNYFDIAFQSFQLDLRTVAQGGVNDDDDVADVFAAFVDIDPALVAEINQRFVHPFGCSGFLLGHTTTFPAEDMFDEDYPVTPFVRQTAAGAPNTCQSLNGLDNAIVAP